MAKAKAVKATAANGKAPALPEGLSLAADAFANPIARLGYGTPSLTESTLYPLTRLSNQYMLMQSLYRGHWIIRKIIDTVPGDMLKAWVRYDTTLQPKDTQLFDNALKFTKTKHRLMETLQWSRLYGGAGAVMIIKGHDLSTPLEIDDVEPDSYRGLLVFDRWSGIQPGDTLYADIENPTLFGLPSYYACQTASGQNLRVDASRVLRFTGRALPQWERQATLGWGESEVEVVFEELKKRDNTSWSIVNLMFRANILAMTGMDVAQQLSVGTSQSQSRIQMTLDAINTMMSNQGLLILPKDANLESHQYTFAGIKEIYEQFALDICGACEIPMTRLFGRTATGLGQSNDADEQQYYESIAQKQEAHLRSPLEQLFPVIAMSTWGEIPKDFDFSFNSARTATDKEQAELAEKKTAAVLSVFTGGGIGRKTMLKELRQMSDQTGLWSNIDDAMIEEADDEVQPAGEFGMGDGTGEDETDGAEPAEKEK